MMIGLLLTAIILALTLVILNDKSALPPISGDDLEDISSITPKPEEPEKPSEEITYIPSFPKSSSASDTYLYTQSLCGIGNVALGNIHQTTVGLYTVATTDCAIGDIGGAKPTVGIAKSDALGNIEAVFNLPTTAPCYYVTSQITPLGPVIITYNSNKKYLYVHIVDYALSEVKTHLISYADNATIYPCADSFIILADCSDESLIYNYSNGEFTFQSLPACNIVKVFEYKDYYSIFYNSQSGYALCELYKNSFTVKKELFVSSATLIDIIPLMQNGEQVFVALESDGALYAKKYDKTFSPTTAERKKMGAYEVLGTGSDGQRIYMAVKGSMNGIVTLNADLSSSFNVTDASFLAVKIHDFLYLKGKFYLLATSAEGVLALISMDKEVSDISYFETTAGRAKFAYNPNGTFVIAYDGKFHDYSSVNYIGLSR